MLSLILRPSLKAVCCLPTREGSRRLSSVGNDFRYALYDRIARRNRPLRLLQGRVGY